MLRGYDTRRNSFPQRLPVLNELALVLDRMADGSTSTSSYRCRRSDGMSASGVRIRILHVPPTVSYYPEQVLRVLVVAKKSHHISGPEVEWWSYGCRRVSDN